MLPLFPSFLPILFRFQHIFPTVNYKINKYYRIVKLKKSSIRIIGTKFAIDKGVYFQQGQTTCEIKRKAMSLAGFPLQLLRRDIEDP